MAKIWMSVCFAILAVAGCASGGDDDPAMTKDEARRAGGKSDGGWDFCALFDWYGDGICDDFCPEPDPDCSPGCPLTGIVCTPDCVGGQSPGGAPCQRGTWNEATCACVDAPTCEDLGGTCRSSPMDVTFPANCEQDFGETTSDGVCAAFNQACCVPVDCPLTGIVCTPDCLDGHTDGGAPCQKGTFNPLTCECVDPCWGAWLDENGSCRAPNDGAYPAECCADQERHCGGFAGLLCQDAEYCDYPLDAQCGAADQMGTCRTRPEACAQFYDPVCGCDGLTYGNACEANAAGTSVASDGECAVADCRDTGCPNGQECQLCWAQWACVPNGAMC